MDAELRRRDQNLEDALKKRMKNGRVNWNKEKKN